MQWTAFNVSFLAALGALIIVLFVLPGPQRIHINELEKELGLKDKFQKLLQSAGIFDQAPSMLLLILGAFSVVLGLLFILVFNILFAFILGPVLVASVFLYYIRDRQRRFIQRASDELVPFLNRIVTAVVSGQPAPQAYLDAVEESVWLRDVLEDSAAQISSGERFSHALLSTLPLLPLRMWSAFVRQLELYEEVGGDVGKAIERSVSQVNTMLQLQAEARADYAIQAWQQRIIIFIVIGATLLWAMVDPGRVSQVLSNPIGIAGIVLGAGVILFGIWFLNKQLRDVERKLSF